ncbi:UNVERIFIED_CONTAM: Wall-associated receptor kinase-like 1 [Sesamum calycinum]|uniref:Wall-associated receptor kinase-like 1 n=1 Tax=Sesamum calycinum TaxID=2727403 RepID=A0AAW2JG91_9LAMI
MKSSNFQVTSMFNKLGINKQNLAGSYWNFIEYVDSKINGRDEQEKGLLWKLPAVKSKQLGKLGPAFGVGAGCGFGFAVGLIGGTGFGPGIPGWQLGFGLGAGCGVGLGFGYGVGRGIAYDENRRYTNVGRFFHNRGIFLCREGNVLQSRSLARSLFVTIASLGNRVGTGFAVGLVILFAIGIWTWRKLKKIKEKKMKDKYFKRNGGLRLQQQRSPAGGSVLLELTLFRIEKLEKATDKFSQSRILGKGWLGTVYKGMLSDGRIVAAHCQIVGCCLEAEVPLLVYKYVSNGTLEVHLHNEPNSSTFSWKNRLRIAAEVAGALAFSHPLSIDKTHLNTFVGGTFGDLDPEYFRSGQLNDKSDVYAFGVVLAEILTGQKAISSMKDDQGLALRFRSAVKENCLFEILEQVVVYEGEKEEILAVAQLAKRCLKINARKRPNMKEVAAELEQLRSKKEVPEYQESFQDEYRAMSENCYNFGIDSQAEGDQTMFRMN